jgi:hypothetical protein
VPTAARHLHLALAKCVANVTRLLPQRHPLIPPPPPGCAHILLCLQKRVQEQGCTDQEKAESGPYPSTASAGVRAPDAPPADLGQTDLSKRGADDATAGPDDFSRTPQKAMEQAEANAVDKNAHTST